MVLRRHIHKSCPGAPAFPVFQVFPTFHRILQLSSLPLYQPYIVVLFLLLRYPRLHPSTNDSHRPAPSVSPSLRRPSVHLSSSPGILRAAYITLVAAIAFIPRRLSIYIANFILRIQPE